MKDFRSCTHDKTPSRAVYPGRKGKEMIYAVVRTTNEIICRCDAWEMGGEQRMRKEAREAGYVPMESEITFMGDMVIWCE